MSTLHSLAQPQSLRSPLPAAGKRAILEMLDFRLQLTCARLAHDHLAQSRRRCFTFAHFHCFENQSKSSLSDTLESCSFRKVCTVRNEDSERDWVPGA